MAVAKMKGAEDPEWEKYEKSKSREVRDQEKSENGKYKIKFEIQIHEKFEKMARNLYLFNVIFGHCWELINNILYGQSLYLPV